MLQSKRTKNDNSHFQAKIHLRQEFTKNIKHLAVLDVFAGNNRLWKHFNCHKYYGIEKEKNKGRNLNADNLRVIPEINLSEYNVIDLDSYGIPVKQLIQIMSNVTFQRNTTIFYTAITSPMSAINKEILEHYGITKQYKKASTLFNAYSMELFHGWLYDQKIEIVDRITFHDGSYFKEYGAIKLYDQ